jgi:hypothetical protein
MDILCYDAFIIITCNAKVLLLYGLSHSCNARSSIPMRAYNILILLSTAVITTAVFNSLLLLLHYSHCHKTVTTDKLLRASLFLGAGELTTHLLKLTNIFGSPCAESINLGFTSLKDCCDPLYLWVISTDGNFLSIVG